MTKRCRKCGEEKDCSEFSSEKRNRDGLFSWCKSCAREYNKARWPKRKAAMTPEQRERITRYAVGYRKKNRAKRAEYNRKWLVEHPGKTKEYDARYRSRSGSKILDKNSKQRAARRKVRAEKVDRTWIYHRDGGVCWICGGAVDEHLRGRSPESMSIDHVVPISRGGPHMEWNVRLAHLGCNIKKGYKLLKGENDAG